MKDKKDRGASESQTLTRGATKRTVKLTEVFDDGEATVTERVRERVVRGVKIKKIK